MSIHLVIHLLDEDLIAFIEQMFEILPERPPINDWEDDGKPASIGLFGHHDGPPTRDEPEWGRTER